MREKNQWERLEAVIKWANMSTNYFARYIGLARGENLYQIKRGNNGISMPLVERIVGKFPQIDKLWLLTGDGNMFVDGYSTGCDTPFFDLDAEQNFRLTADSSPASMLRIAPVGKCDIAMRYNGRAMGPVTPAGSVVMLQRVEADGIIFGEEYLVVGKKTVNLRFVRMGDEEGRVRLVAGDREHYDDVMINLSDIVEIYRVKAKLIINA